MKLALTDSLTELGNYRHFCQKMDEYEEAVREPGLKITLCLFDVDNFKSINDTYGHLTGDAALRSLAAAMRQDTEAFRIGGDEFALLPEGRTEDEAREITARITARIGDASSEHGKLELSAGLASFPQDGLHFADLVACADIALYASKNAGKNQISCYRPGHAMSGQRQEDHEASIGVSRATGRSRSVRAALVVSPS